MVGRTLGHYEILEPLGAGGMGEVYKALDTKLGREVAIKVLPEAFSENEERLARFEREARLLASLNHPNMATLFDFQESEGVHFLVLELVPGQTLSERIEPGGAPDDEILPIFRQIAEALEAAHDSDVIHRDLKPANVKITPDGMVKVLDFGLAKALTREEVAQDLSQSPTLTQGAVGGGVLLGTAPYMSPEQARGKPVDKRADIWAFGCCLFEALTGTSPFLGETVSDTISTVLGGEPDWEALPSDVSPAIRTLLRRCLDKDAKRRLRDIGEARIAIDGAPMVGVDYLEGVPPPAKASWKRTLVLSMGAAALAGTVVAVSVWLAMRPIAPRVTRLSIIPSVNAPLSSTALAISPDGSRIVYVAAGSSQLSVRAIDELEPNDLANLGSPRQPFISPDGQWIGFFDSVNALKKVAMTGGAAISVCSMGGAAPMGGSWSPDGWIIYGTDDPATGLWRVPDSGGEPELLTTPDRDLGDHWWPQVLPGGREVLLTLRGRRVSEPQVAVLDLESGEIKTLLPGSHARYVPTGHLVYGISETLRAVEFDLDRLEAIGASVPVQERVATTRTGAMAFAVADDGTLVYVPGEMQGSSRRLVWVDRQGNEELLATPPGGYYIPRLSPDGTKVAIDNRESGADIWIWDFARQAMTRFTFTGGPYPVWTPDGERIVFSSFDSGVGNLAWRIADSSAPLELLTEGSNSRYASSFTPDGAYLVFREEGRPTGLDIMILEMEGDRQAELLLGTQFNELNAEISPDGRWLAYKSNESRRDEVYVRPFPNVNDGLWQITTDGGMHPAWARSGRELFYRAPDGALMGVPVELQPSFSAGTPTKILDGSDLLGGPGRAYDVSPDGERFLMITGGEGSADAASLPSLVVVQNWFEDLKRLVPREQ